MAANTRAKTSGFTLHEEMTFAQATQIDKNAGESVNRHSTSSGYKRIPITFAGTTGDVILGAGTPGALKHYFKAGKLYVCEGITDHIWFSLPILPEGHILHSVKAYFKPESGHGGTPGALPSIKLMRRYSSATTVGTATYSWVDLATYETGGWYLEIDDINQTQTGNEEYILGVVGESGANEKVIEMAAFYVYMTMDVAEGGADMTFWT